jgi:soluble lytic murein transglycosylase-like protein
MLEEIAQIQTDISEIQAKIASLTPAPAVQPSAAGTRQPSFAQALAAAQGTPGTAAMSGSSGTPQGIAVPPASLGPLPPLPVQPGAGSLTPLPVSVSNVSDFESLIQASATQNGVDPSLIRAVIQTESGGNPKAVSSAGAMGLMQLMPANVQEAGVSNPFDPAQNIAAGTQQLAGLLKKYNGNVTLALAAYNAGPGNVQKYGGIPPFPETQDYIRKVRAAMGKG